MIRKRSLVAEKIHTQMELRRLVDDPDQPDATLKLLSPEIDRSTIRYKAHRVRNRFFRPGACQRMGLDIFS